MFFRTQFQDCVTPVSLLVIGYGERDLALSLELGADLPVQGLLAAPIRKEVRSGR